MAPDHNIMLTPCKMPPTQAMIAKWLKSQQQDRTEHIKPNNQTPKSRGPFSERAEAQGKPDKKKTPGKERIESKPDKKDAEFLSPSRPVVRRQPSIPKPFPTDTVVAGPLSFSTSNCQPISSTPLAAAKAAPLRLSLPPGLVEIPKGSVSRAVDALFLIFSVAEDALHQDNSLSTG